jgi:hypothetical protein
LTRRTDTAARADAPPQPAFGWSDAYRWLDLDPEELLAKCRQGRFQGSGPGGQKRNRVYSGVRLTHADSGLSSESVDGRESLRNLHHALRRLRGAIAVAPARESVAAPALEDAASGHGFRVDANPAHADFPRSLLRALHALALHRGRLAEAAAALGCTGSALTRLLREDKDAWRTAGEIRKREGLAALK